MASDRPALFDRFPALAARLPHVPLGRFPTPVRRLERLGARLGLEHLYLKDDGKSGPLYGGNKVRKLEFLLGEALREGAKEVLTFGCAGSNHALATALYARALGLGAVSMLFPQPNSRHVRKNLLWHFLAGAELRHYDSYPAMADATEAVLAEHRERRGVSPYVIPAGGSSPLGVAGFVSAAFELKRQVDEGLLPEPDLVYVPLGTAGTAAGLMIGCEAAGLKTKVAPALVVDPRFMPETAVAQLYDETRAFLRSLDPSFPETGYARRNAGLEGGFLGDGYGVFTGEGRDAVALMREEEGIALEGTYTGKAFAALAAHARAGKLAGKTVLYWNTLNAVEAPPEAATLDYRLLPRPLHRYFEEAVQTLDF